MSTRRTFLKLLGLAGAAGIVHYAEPLQAIQEALPALHEWVEDRGDFYVVRVPELKSFASEHLDKPTIFILGYGGIVSSVSVNGFANIAAPRGGLVTNCYFDGRGVATERPRPTVEVNGSGLVIHGSYIQPSASASSALKVLV